MSPAPLHEAAVSLDVGKASCLHAALLIKASQAQSLDEESLDHGAPRALLPVNSLEHRHSCYSHTATSEGVTRTEYLLRSKTNTQNPKRVTQELSAGPKPT